MVLQLGHRAHHPHLRAGDTSDLLLLQRCARPAHNEDKDFTNRNPYFMPDGKHFLFVQRSATDSGSVYARSLDGSDSKKILSVGSNVAYSNGCLFYVKDSTLMAQSFTGKPVPIAE